MAIQYWPNKRSVNKAIDTHCRSQWDSELQSISITCNDTIPIGRGSYRWPLNLGPIIQGVIMISKAYREMLARRYWRYRRHGTEKPTSKIVSLSGAIPSRRRNHVPLKHIVPSRPSRPDLKKLTCRTVSSSKKEWPSRSVVKYCNYRPVPSRIYIYIFSPVPPSKTIFNLPSRRWNLALPFRPAVTAVPVMSKCRDGGSSEWWLLPSIPAM